MTTWKDGNVMGQGNSKGAPANGVNAPRDAWREEMQANFKNFVDVDAVCPFYIGVDASGRLLRCEALFEHSTITTTFRSPKWCLEYVREYCQSFNCEKCRLYRALDQKYDVVGNLLPARRRGRGSFQRAKRRPIGDFTESS